MKAATQDLCASIHLPDSALRQHIAILGKTGSGKTFTAKGIVEKMLAAGGLEMGRTEVAERAGYEASGGSFNRYVSHLSSLRLIRYPKRTTVAAAAWLFPERNSA